LSRSTPGTDEHHKLHGIAFEPGQGGENTQPLHVEVYFNKGQKYTSVWSVADDGTRTLLTATPVVETDYEYDLYKRATALYPACPSDGYELLRFGRILSSPVTLVSSSANPSAGTASLNAQAVNQCATWFLVTWSAGQKGYIDISDPTILKLSDADFPSFTGWEKISDGHTPFDQDGLCDVERLKKFLKDAKDHQTPEEVALTDEYRKEDVLSRYVRTTDGVRAKLRGFVCEAPGEWDSTHNETRYGKLKEPGEFYEGNEAGYRKFIAFLESFQFWDHTGLAAGEKLWFFHPLQFIRYFRRCGWLSLREQIQLLPRNSMPDAGGQISWHESRKRLSEGNNDARGQSPRGMWLALNRMHIKYGINSSLRKAHFLGQVLKETGALCSTRENGDATYFRKMYESYTSSDAAYDYDHKYNWIKKLGFLKDRDRSTYIAERPNEVQIKAVSNGNVQPGDGARFKGRGLIHLTWRNGYSKYEQYRHLNFTTDPNPELVQSSADVAADSGGYFWARNRINIKADKGARDEDVQRCFNVVGGAGGLPARQQFFRYVYFILNDNPKQITELGLKRQIEDA